MDLVFYLSAANNVFAILGLAGVVNAQRELVTAFFAYNTVQVVLSFHMFVDVLVDSGIEFGSVGKAGSGPPAGCIVIGRERSDAYRMIPRPCTPDRWPPGMIIMGGAAGWC